jgi:hypothetical protein
VRAGVHAGQAAHTARMWPRSVLRAVVPLLALRGPAVGARWRPLVGWPRRAAGTTADDGAAAAAQLPDFESADPLRVLGLPPTATAADIKRAYYRLALLYHPDAAASTPTRDGTAAPLSAEARAHRFRRVGDAYRAALVRTDVTAKSTLTADVASVRGCVLPPC